MCLEPFTCTDRRPKSLPCGHTFCLRCLQTLPAKKCPLDNKVFVPSPDTLPDNFMVLDLSNKSVGTTSSRLWCRSCHKNALDDCVDDHPEYLCTLKKARVEEAGPALRSLERGEAALEKLGNTLDAAARELAQVDSRGRLERERANLVAARGRLQDALEADGATWTLAKSAAEQGGLSRTATQLVPDLANPAATCVVTVQRAEGGGVVWRAAVKPAEDAATRVLLCHLAAQGGLEQQEEPQQEQRADASSWQESCNGEDGEEIVEEIAAAMEVGSRVMRGRDWDPSWTEDGAAPGHGTVTLKDNDGTVTVKWDDGGTSAVYFMGCDGKYDLQRVVYPHRMVLRVGPLKPELTVAHEGEEHFLDVGAIQLDSTLDETMWELLTDGSLARVRCLVSLPCKTFITWSQRALLQVALHLEGLHMISPLQRHLDVALKMPRLQTLCITGVTGEQLLQVAQAVGQTAALRRLEVHCPFDAPLPVLAFPAAPEGLGLQWLRCGVYPLATALALARAHANSLGELQLVAASLKPYRCPDLAQELRSCGFKKLTRLALLRQTVYWRLDDCRHEMDSCENQREHLKDMFDESSLNVSVLCNVCDYEQFPSSD